MSSVRHLVHDDLMVLGFDDHLHVVADPPQASATGAIKWASGSVTDS